MTDEMVVKDPWEPESWGRPAAEEPLTFDSADQARFSEALMAWAQHHPCADQPLIDIAQGEDETSVSPRRLAAAYQDDGDPLHETIRRLFAVGLSGYRGDPDELLRVLVGTLEDEARHWPSDLG